MARELSRRDFLAMTGMAISGAAVRDVRAACAAHDAEAAGHGALLRFPTGFLWGAATSAYQIEGAVHADGRGESIWDRFSHTPGKTLHGDTGDVACDHYHRYRQDLALMQHLGLRSYRFSIAWPRVQPAGTGRVNQKGLDFYRRLVDGLLQRGIHPMATLYHWDLPQPLQDRGGWPNREIAKWFAAYAEVVFHALGDTVSSWITLNEPWVVANLGYRSGSDAPGIRDPQQATQAIHHLLLGHGLAVQAFRALHLQGSEVGITLNLVPVYPVSQRDNDRAAAWAQDGFINRTYLDPIFRGAYPADVIATNERQGISFRHVKPGDLTLISTPVDFLGVNYYQPWYVTGTAAHPQLVSGHHPRTVMGWEIVPGGLHDLLVRLTRDYGHVPIYITENGAAFDDRVDVHGRVDDLARVRFLHDHVVAAHGALRAGVNLKGYEVWSLLDNFEWISGYSKRFGIVYVDYPTQRRIPKRSALWYRDVIRQNGVAELLNIQAHPSL
jgi:beta-glucosidase